MQLTPKKYLNYAAAVAQIGQKQLIDGGKAHVIATLTENSVLAKLRPLHNFPDAERG